MRLPAVASLAAFAFAAVPAAASSPPGVTASEVAPFHYASPLAAPRSLRLSGWNGAVRVTASSDATLDVRAVVSGGDASRVASLRVVTREEPGGVAICVFYADESPDGCRLGGVDRKSSGHGSHNEPSIDLVARVPAGVSLTADTLNGAIVARGLSGELRATTLNGDVNVSASNVAEATTLNGNVNASFARPPAGKIKLSTSNGNVLVTFTGALDADVNASTVHGEITTSFPMAISTTAFGFGPKSGHAHLGSGAAQIEARSINGNVELRGS